MKQNNRILFLIILVVCLFTCGCVSSMFMNSRVLQVKDDTAIVEGMGVSRAEARLNAEKEAVKLFGEYTETKDAEYTNTKHGDTDYSRTYVICTMYIKKK